MRKVKWKLRLNILKLLSKLHVQFKFQVIDLDLSIFGLIPKSNSSTTQVELLTKFVRRRWCFCWILFLVFSQGHLLFIDFLLLDFLTICPWGGTVLYSIRILQSVTEMSIDSSWENLPRRENDRDEVVRFKNRF